jgi:CUE domain
MATQSIDPNTFSSTSMEQLIADHFSGSPPASSVTAPQPSETTQSPGDSVPSSLGVQEMHPGENATSPTPPVEEAAIPDPRIVPLLAIFPTFDHAILADVLDSCNGNEEKAVDILLGMTDPDHIPQTNVQDIVSPLRQCELG